MIVLILLLIINIIFQRGSSAEHLSEPHSDKKLLLLHDFVQNVSRLLQLLSIIIKGEVHPEMFCSHSEHHHHHHRADQLQESVGLLLFIIQDKEINVLIISI